MVEEVLSSMKETMPQYTPLQEKKILHLRFLVKVQKYKSEVTMIIKTKDKDKVWKNGSCAKTLY